MSLFETTPVDCPSCGAAVSFDLVYSVNADRKPILREQILDQSFQRETCPSCSHAFRIEPEFTYLDVGRGIWLGCWQTKRLADWERWAAQAQTSYDKAFGTHGPPAAQAIGDGLRVRVTFGWDALREKIIAFEAGLDDLELELAKATIIRQDGPPDSPNLDLRLLEVQEGALVFCWVDRETGLREEVFAVDRELLQGVRAAGPAFDALRQELDGGMHVDIHRMTLPKAEGQAAR